MARGESFDVVIVGGGAAGCVVARRLSERGGARALLLEAGPDLRDAFPPDLHDGWRLPKIPDWGFRADAGQDGGEGEPLRRGRLLGGTSWLTRFAVRGALSDFDGWEAAGNPGWGAADVLPAFRAIEADADFGDRPWHGVDGPIPITRYRDLEPTPIHAAIVEAFHRQGDALVEDHNAPGAIGAGRLPMSSSNGRRMSSVDAYLPPDVELTALTIRCDTPVDRVLVDGGRATGVRLADGSSVAAGAVVVCAGTYGSPPLLLRSGIGPGADLRALGIRIVAELPGVGANLADHPATEIEVGWRGEGGTGPILHTIVTMRTSHAPAAGGPDLMFWISDPVAADPHVYADPILLRPASRGRVSLRSLDPGAAPRIELPGVRDPADVARLVEGLEHGLAAINDPVVRALCAEAPAADPGSPSARAAFVTESAYSLPHVVGTCAMGPAPDAGAVVNARGRVHGVPGLFVIDASIIPEPPSGFPHLITLMIAERLAAGVTAG